VKEITATGRFFSQPDLQAKDYQFPTNDHHISHPPGAGHGAFLSRSDGDRRAEQIQVIFAGSSGLIG